jgi:hypothetical protein
MCGAPLVFAGIQGCSTKTARSIPFAESVIFHGIGFAQAIFATSEILSCFCGDGHFV